jgi:[acyl-carrier-protein] S-malonyltransferase
VPDDEGTGVALLLPGQGSQYPGMGTGLYGTEPVFRDAVEEVLGALGPAGRVVRAEWLAGRPVDRVGLAQPLLLAVDLGLGRLVLDWGVPVAGLLGHSIGELAAATLAGVFPVPEAVALLADRVVRLGTAPRGGMAAVAAGWDEIAGLVGPRVALAAVNAPWQTVLAGPPAELAATAAAIAATGRSVRPVPADVAFHSAELAPAMAGAALGVRPRPARHRIVSGFTGRDLDPATLADPAFWASHPVAPVLFWPALDRLLTGHRGPVLETGPGQGLSLLARRHPAARAGRVTVTTLLGRPPRPGEDPAVLEPAALARARALLAPVPA